VRSASPGISSEGGPAIRPDDPRPAIGNALPATPGDEVPLIVDLDGTLVRSDLVVESLMLLAKRRPWRLPGVLGALAQGPARFKQALAAEAMPDIGTLPFDPTFLAFLERQKAAGRKLVLVTGADIRLAHAVAAHTGLFDRVISSDGSNNVTGRLKRDLLVTEFGLKGFDYAGREDSDAPVVSAARRAILVDIPSERAHGPPGDAEVEDRIARSGGGAGAYLRALRPDQWVKSLLVFLPLLAAAQPLEPALLLRGLLAAAAFSLCASSGYVVNDLVDLPSDRQHPSKRARPIAAGEVSLGAMLLLAPVLVLAGIAVGLLLSPDFAGLLGIYYATTLAYSLRLKDIVILDVLALAFLYTLRVLAGAVALGLHASVWLLAFSALLFLSLGLVKRYGELVVMRSVEGSHAHARAYLLPDRGLLAGFGTASGYLAALLLVLFQSRAGPVPGAVDLDPEGWAICALFTYWISYIWLMAHRGRLGDDPLSFSLRDRTSRVLIALACLALAVRWLR